MSKSTTTFTVGMKEFLPVNLAVLSYICQGREANQGKGLVNSLARLEALASSSLVCR